MLGAQHSDLAFPTRICQSEGGWRADTAANGASSEGRGVGANPGAVEVSGNTPK